MYTPAAVVDHPHFRLLTKLTGLFLLAGHWAEIVHLHNDNHENREERRGARVQRLFETRINSRPSARASEQDLPRQPEHPDTHVSNLVYRRRELV